MTSLMISPTGMLYTVGYAQPHAQERIDALMQQHERILLVDIRLRPVSGWNAAWNAHALTSRYGKRYIWERRLGNLNYQHRERGIQLAEGYEQAIEKAALLLHDHVSLILLCACKQEASCHRSLVARLIEERWGRLHTTRTVTRGVQNTGVGGSLVAPTKGGAHA